MKTILKLQVFHYFVSGGHSVVWTRLILNYTG